MARDRKIPAPALKFFIIFAAAFVVLVLLIGAPSTNFSSHRHHEVNYNGLLGDSSEADILNNTSIAQDDPRLVQLVSQMLIPPSVEPYNFWNADLADRHKNIDPSAGQSQAVKDILEGFGPKGFFIECGAGDGELLSNTVWAERNMGWSGVLIEPDPRSFGSLFGKHRKTFLGNFCLSKSPHPQRVSFFLDASENGLGSGLIKSELYHATREITVQCIPLYTVLLALERTTIDFFSLDVEGNEIEILKTLPPDVIFKVITIEHDVLKEGKLGLRKFMEERGYIFYRTVGDEDFKAGDSIFVHKSVKLTESQLAIVGTDSEDFTRPPRNK